MTRKKKTRSLKRIHSVKTGNASKLKRDGDTDRQSSNLKSKNKPKSVYQKFLEQNPDAIEKQSQPKSAAPEKANKPKKEQSNSQEKSQSKPATHSNVDKKREDEHAQAHETSKDNHTEREPDLLSQLDNKNFKDFY